MKEEGGKMLHIGMAELEGEELHVYCPNSPFVANILSQWAFFCPHIVMIGHL